MQYGLSRLVHDSNKLIPISEQEYAEARVASENALELLTVEENYHMLLENYEEFQAEILRLSLRRSLWDEHDWFSSADRRRTINRRLQNLRSTCRLYLDQMRRSVSRVFGKDSAQWQELDAERKQQYESLLGYRVMDALRNHMQHSGLLVHVLTFARPVCRRCG
jgi:hypothetical protein